MATAEQAGFLERNCVFGLGVTEREIAGSEVLRAPAMP